MPSFHRNIQALELGIVELGGCRMVLPVQNDGLKSIGREYSFMYQALSWVAERIGGVDNVIAS